jgi:hypothetical protein
MHEAAHDPVARRFSPDRELLVRAQRHMIETEGERQRFVRQRWEEAFGAVRVALDALREIWPSERDAMHSVSSRVIGEALDEITTAYAHLDDACEEIVGREMYFVLTGVVKTTEEFDEMLTRLVQL